MPKKILYKDVPSGFIVIDPLTNKRYVHLINSGGYANAFSLTNPSYQRTFSNDYLVFVADVNVCLDKYYYNSDLRNKKCYCGFSYQDHFNSDDEFTGCSLGTIPCKEIRLMEE